uniref:Uncharacterized protein n=1 Tax=Rhizophora mucronata TaxID=61149 RepID=A0A2P2KI58_RHIMU
MERYVIEITCLIKSKQNYTTEKTVTKHLVTDPMPLVPPVTRAVIPLRDHRSSLEMMGSACEVPIFSSVIGVR